MTDDELIAQVCGVEVPRFACGCPRGFGTGFGYRDPLARCRECRERSDRNKLLVFAAIVLVGAFLLVWWRQ